MARFSLLLLVLSLGVVACDPVWNQGFVPKNYRYENDLYKSQPGRAAHSLGYTYTEEKNKEITGQWQRAVDSLVAEMEIKSGITPADIHIYKNYDNAFNNSFDDALRRALIKRGYTLASTPQATYGLRYSAEQQKEFIPTPAYNADVVKEKKFQEYQPFLMSIELEHQQKALGKGSGIYTLPVYGYRKSWPFPPAQKPIEHRYEVNP